MRGKQAPKRKLKPDPKYQSQVISKFINYIMRNGKKSIAQGLVYRACDIIQKESGTEPLEIFEKAIKNVSPILEVKSRRIGGANYQIPTQVRGERRNALAFRWLIQASKNTHKGIGMDKRLAKEILAASNEEGAAMAKKLDVQRMAESNRAFAHFAR